MDEQDVSAVGGREDEQVKATKRPKLIVGHSYRFTFTPVDGARYGDAFHEPYSTVVTIEDKGDRTARAVHLWANRWIAYGRNTVDIVEVVEDGAS